MHTPDPAVLLESCPDRLAALASYRLFGTEPHQAYDQIAQLVGAFFQVPIVSVALIGAEELWFKSSVSATSLTVPLRDTFCYHDLYVPGGLVVNDATQDDRFRSNPYVTRDEVGVRFYAGAPLQTSDGHIIGTLCILDIQPRAFSESDHEMLRIMADQVLAQMELYKSHQILHEQMEALEAKRAELEQLNASKDRFFSIIAHDLRAPFQGILGFSEVLANEFDEMSPTEIRNLALYLHDTAAGAYKLLDNLLQWSMVESGKMRFAPRQIQVEDLFDEVEGSLAGVARQKNVQLTFEPALARTLYGDVNMVRTVLQNLVNNAIKFTPAQGAVNVSAKTTSAGTYLVVQDSGVGMGIEQQNRLLRGDVQDSTRGTAGEGGTGLGLMLTQQFVQRHSGAELLVESAPGHGTTFLVFFPHAAAEGPAKTDLHLPMASP